MATGIHRNPPFRAKHLGPLFRPNDLLQTREKCKAGSVKQEELTEAEDKAVNYIVNIQLYLGYHAITDGEYRQHSTYRWLLFIGESIHIFTVFGAHFSKI